MGWPPGWVDDERLAAWMADRPAGEDRAAPETRLDDLYLTCACAAGNQAAIRAFEARYFIEVDRVVARMGPSGLSSDELRQRLRVKLFVGEGDRPPACTRFTGRGELGAWFRTVVTRLMLDQVAARREVPTEDKLFDALITDGESAEVIHLRDVYRTELRAALGEATTRLSTVEKNLLRYAFVDSLSIDAIGAIYRVHRATAARRLDAAREALGTHLRDVLTERLQVGQTELGSIMRLVLSSVDITFARYLARP